MNDDGTPAGLNGRSTSNILVASAVTVDVHLRDEVVHAVRGLDLTIAPRRLTAMVGASGSGKTMFARAVSGALPRRATATGSILVAGRDVLGSRKPSRTAVAMAFQDAAAAFNPTHTIGWHLSESCRAASVPGTWRSAARRALADAGLDDVQVLDAYAWELSGGQVQRAGLALALVSEPRLLVADEITSALDPATQAEVLEGLRSVASRREQAVLFVTHDLALAEEWADEIAVVADGRVVEHGAASSVINQPAHARTLELTRSRLPVVRRLDPSERPRAQRASTAQTSRTRSVDAPVVEAVDVTRRYTGRHGRSTLALDAVSLTIAPGESVALTGRSGSGKSTMLRLLAGLERPDAGAVRWAGDDVTHLGRESLRRRRWRVQVVFQNPLDAMDPRESVASVIAAPLRSFPERLDGSLDDRVTELLRSVGLDPALARRRPTELSGGQRQRVAIARALAPRPDAVLCDEPIASLDAELRRSMVELLDHARRSAGTALVFVTHDLAPVPLLCDRIVELSSGRVVLDDDVETALSP